MNTAIVLMAMTLGAATAPTDGSLLVLQNSNKPVAGLTDSDLTHVAMLRTLDGELWVYEATPNRVRRLPLIDYRREVARCNVNRTRPMRVWLMQPAKPYTVAERASMFRYLDEQVGRRYSIKGYVRGKSGDGIHCAQYCSRALAESGRYRFANHATTSPVALVNTVRDSHLPPQRVVLGKVASEESWSERGWQRMAAIQLWLTWACYEAWTLCW